jgi:hypothetical protein
MMDNDSRRKRSDCRPLGIEELPHQRLDVLQELEASAETLATGYRSFAFRRVDQCEKFAGKGSEAHSAILHHCGELDWCRKLHVVASLQQAKRKRDVGLNIPPGAQCLNSDAHTGSL